MKPFQKSYLLKVIIGKNESVIISPIMALVEGNLNEVILDL